MSEPHLTLKVGRISVRIGAQALATFDAHRQRRFFQREAGGQRFARVRDTDWEIVTATVPRPRDRFSFWPHRASEQEEIVENHALGLDYVGDWHTHPEDASMRPGYSAGLFLYWDAVSHRNLLESALSLRESSLSQRRRDAAQENRRNDRDLHPTAR
ncbi:Mov34/MPN/PAD-1 family protein [Bradyrhizobium arachidis]|uniref:Mov34/MPN/PAD-1 family protein n=1 Tax=Bradyrhizobium arachidis TaxID=858423 RepID=UPI0021627948|nr:Mov34/MPN/PAD-1 family protein [Bradyrhizobium arachidis]UVO30182.1 Mov34/MPN/PAD-1 family protein [Bradyrhizobium arachidis]